MPRKKRKSSGCQKRYLVTKPDPRDFARMFLQGSRSATYLAAFYNCTGRALLQKSQPFVIVPAYVTQEQNYPFCVFRAFLGDELISATLN